MKKRAYSTWEGEKRTSIDARAIRTQLLAIRDHVRRILEEGNPQWNDVASLLSEYTDAKIAFSIIMSKEKVNVNLRYLHDLQVGVRYSPTELMTKLREIEIGCLKGAEALAGLVSRLPAEELDKLQALRKELDSMSSGLEEVDSQNASMAIAEYEKGDHLASVLIASRMIIYALDQIPGGNDDAKIKTLMEKRVIQSGREDIQRSIVKASRKARNFFSHDIRVSPLASDALSLLGDMVQILNLLVELRLLEQDAMALRITEEKKARKARGIKETKRPAFEKPSE